LDATILDKIFDYEFSQLILLSTLGIMLLISLRDLIMLYLAIELLSLSFYVLAAIKRDSQHSVEAGLKYFLLGALSSGLLLFGMALIYTFTGETNFDAINQYL
jgi:NADH-quinone oxidoreductase subunit N